MVVIRRKWGGIRQERIRIQGKCRMVISRKDRVVNHRSQFFGTIVFCLLSAVATLTPHTAQALSTPRTSSTTPQFPKIVVSGNVATDSKPHQFTFAVPECPISKGCYVFSPLLPNLERLRHPQVLSFTMLLPNHRIIGGNVMQGMLPLIMSGITSYFGQHI